MRLTQMQIRSFQEMIFSWWDKNHRDLPWRRTHDPYNILVSEIMLQQTQVSRVRPIYQQFIKQFPNVHSLAHATAADVLKQWKGMGYNRRALYLKKTAEIIVDVHKGIFPRDVSVLCELPGIGAYTAGAVAVFAYKQQHAVIDTNIRSIIVHFFFQDKNQKTSDIVHVAQQLLPPNRAWEWHQALMDYGALVLKPHLPKRRRSKAAVVPFLQSNRFFRGRIIDKLREGSTNMIMYLDELEQKYRRPRAFFLAIISALAGEGLIQEGSDGTLKLPE